MRGEGKEKGILSWRGEEECLQSCSRKGEEGLWEPILGEEKGGREYGRLFFLLKRKRRERGVSYSISGGGGC